MKKLLFFSLLVFLTHYPANATKTLNSKQHQQSRSSHQGQKITLWQKADALFENRQFAAALNAYDELIKNPPRTSMMCGNALSEQDYTIAFKRGICLEYLNRHTEAINTYVAELKTERFHGDINIHRRILTLYIATNQMSDLHKILDSWDEPYRLAVEQNKNFSSVPPSHKLRQLLTVYEWEQQRKWNVLIQYLTATEMQHIENPWIRNSELEANESALRLAQHPQQAVPFLFSALRKAKEERKSWLIYTLGLCATESAVKYLQARARIERDETLQHRTIYSLQSAGARGQNALAQLRRSAKPDSQLAYALQAAKQNEFSPQMLKFKFPPVPQELKLPLTLASPYPVYEQFLTRRGTIVKISPQN